MTRIDPYPTGDPLFECLDCSRRFRDPEGRLCPDCGGYLRNIAVSRGE